VELHCNDSRSGGQRKGGCPNLVFNHTYAAFGCFVPEALDELIGKALTLLDLSEKLLLQLPQVINILPITCTGGPADENSPSRTIHRREAEAFPARRGKLHGKGHSAASPGAAPPPSPQRDLYCLASQRSFHLDSAYPGIPRSKRGCFQTAQGVCKKSPSRVPLSIRSASFGE